MRLARSTLGATARLPSPSLSLSTATGGGQGYGTVVNIDSTSISSNSGVGINVGVGSRARIARTTIGQNGGASLTPAASVDSGGNNNIMGNGTNTAPAGIPFTQN